MSEVICTYTTPDHVEIRVFNSLPISEYNTEMKKDPNFPVIEAPRRKILVRYGHAKKSAYLTSNILSSPVLARGFDDSELVWIEVE